MKVPYFFALLLLFTALFSCQREQQPLTVALDKVIYNSYHESLRGRNTIALLKDETVIYHQGRQKVSTRSADIVYQDVKFRISLLDTNQNGIFNEVSTDLVTLSIFGQDTVAIDLHEDNVGILRASTFVQINRTFFLLETDPTGRQLTLIPWERPPADALTARTKTHLAKLSVKDPQGETLSLNLAPNQGKKQLLLFWSFPKDSASPLLHDLSAQQATWSTNYQLTALNMNDHPPLLYSYQSTHPDALTHYIVSSKTCETISCHLHLPYAILLDAKGRILRTNLRESAIRALLLNEAGEKELI